MSEESYNKKHKKLLMLTETDNIYDAIELIIYKRYKPETKIGKMPYQLYYSKNELESLCKELGIIIPPVFNDIEHEPYLKIRFAVLERDGFKCMYCGRNPREDNIKLHVDHILPRSKGGKNELDNLITACSECNLGKKDILLDQRLKFKEELKKAVRHKNSFQERGKFDLQGG